MFGIVSGAIAGSVFQSGFSFQSTEAGDDGIHSRRVLGLVVEASNSRSACATAPSESDKIQLQHARSVLYL